MAAQGYPLERLSGPRVRDAEPPRSPAGLWFEETELESGKSTGEDGPAESELWRSEY